MEEQEMKQAETTNAAPVQMKTRSIRASEEVLNKFKEISESFDNQSECLNQLIATYEISTAKQEIKGLSTDIADYQSHITAIQNAFLHILEINSNAEIRIKQDFEMLLKSKDTTISDLQEKIDKYKDIETELKEKNTELEKSFDNLISKNQSLYSEISLLKNEIAVKDEAISDKSVIIENLNIKISEYDGLLEKNKEVNNTIAEMKKHKQDIELLKKQHELDKKQIEFEIKQQMQDKILSLTEKNSELQEIIFNLKEELNKK